MGLLRRNVAANLLGQAWAFAVQLAIVPVYLRLLGAESYGLVAFFVTITITLQIFDLGLSQTLSREFARLERQPGGASRPDLLRSLAVPYWAIGVTLGAAVFMLGPRILPGVVNAREIDQATLETAVRLMAIALMLQWPQTLYAAALVGLQRMVMLNVLRVGLVTFSALGAVLALLLVDATLQVFFSWQIVAASVGLVMMGYSAWRRVRQPGVAPRFSAAMLRKVWRFAAGMTVLSVLGVLLGQIDKLILIRLLPLEKFAYYSLAGTISNSIYGLVTPLYAALFPRFSALAGAGGRAELSSVYHTAQQVMAVMVAPVAITVSLFSHEILKIWTRDPIAAESAAPIASILILGTGLNGLMFIPYALQLAHGWLQLPIAIAAGFVVFTVPAVIVFASKYGAIGAASVWLALNAAYVLIGVWLTHRRYLPGEAGIWYTRDVLPPVVAAGVGAGLARWLYPAPEAVLPTILAIASALALSLGLAVLAAPRACGQIRSLLRTALR